MAAFAGAAAWWLLRNLDSDTGVRAGAERLKSLPYLSWTDDGSTDGATGGVHLHQPDSAFDGINLYASEVASGALAIDMEGRVVHRWTDRRAEPTIWKLIKPLPDASFGSLVAGGTVLTYDVRSNPLSRFDSSFHHDFDVFDDGRIIAPAFRTRRIARLAAIYPILDDQLEIHHPVKGLESALSMGELIAGVPELRQAAKTAPRRLLDWRLDLLHTNTVTLLPREVSGAGLLWPAGSVLVCWRSLDTVAVVDLEKEKILWHWGTGELEAPHHPTLLANGRLLIFDNGSRRGWSRVVEVEPATGEITWQYRGDPVESFYSSSRGAAQRLPNGNTLIVESQRGRAFEVTRQGRVVWEFLEPRVRKAGWGGMERATIYRMQRIEPSSWSAWKDAALSSDPRGNLD